jgi:hypothetical protein
MFKNKKLVTSEKTITKLLEIIEEKNKIISYLELELKNHGIKSAICIGNLESLEAEEEA